MCARECVPICLCRGMCVRMCMLTSMHALTRYLPVPAQLLIHGGLTGGAKPQRRPRGCHITQRLHKSSHKLCCIHRHCTPSQRQKGHTPHSRKKNNTGTHTLSLELTRYCVCSGAHGRFTAPSLSHNIVRGITVGIPPVTGE